MSFLLISVIYFLVLMVALKKGFIYPVSSLGVSYVDELYEQSESDSLIKPYHPKGKHYGSSSDPYRPDF